MQSEGGAWARPTLSFYGSPGMLDMPTAVPMADGEVGLTAGYFDPNLRAVFNFQITPRLAGAFRYTVIDDYDGVGRDRYARSFDLTYQLAFEGAAMPGVSIGLRDFGGTGLYSSEYLVATKTFGALRSTAGIGWGRLGSYNSFDNPLNVLSTKRFKTRPGNDGGLNQTGSVDFGNWFKGPAALFGGLQYEVSPRLVLTAEYSSDDYTAESQRTDFEHLSPFNFGATYRFANGLDVTGAWMYGNYAGILLTYTFNPASPPGPDDGREGLGPRVTPRSAVALGWGDLVDDMADGGAPVSGRVQGGPMAQAVAAALKAQGIETLGVERNGPSVTIWIQNDRWLAEAQALGRAARALTGVLPADVETMVLVPTREGMALSAVTLRRADLEELEDGLEGSWQIFARAKIEDAAGYPPPSGDWPRWSWGVGAYTGPTFSNPDNIVAETGLSFNAAYTPLPGLVFSTQLRQPVLRTGTGETPTGTSSKITPVRTDAGLYEDTMDLELRELKGDYFFRPGADFYGRVTLGYLEEMYSGLSGEVLWKPVSGPLALGLELNYAVKRDPENMFGLGDYETVTGYASMYYDFGGGYLGQVDAGRYLAKDWGATISFAREFSNGFRIGAYATLTDVSSEDFGEGSFDKGISFSLPLTWLFGQPTRKVASTTIRPINGDGGARMQISDRLYEVVRGDHVPMLQQEWGRFWR